MWLWFCFTVLFTYARLDTLGDGCMVHMWYQLLTVVVILLGGCEEVYVEVIHRLWVHVELWGRE